MTRKRKTPPLGEREKLRRDSNPAIKNRILCSMQVRFEHGGNPLAAWDAFLRARWMKEPIPEWVLAYFEKTAEALCKIPKGKPPEHVMRSLGLQTRGKGNAFSRYLDEITRWRVVRRCIQLHEEVPNCPYEKIFMDVVEEFYDKGIDLQIRTVEEWFGKLQEIVRET
jgi:hypothetical protein